MRDVFLLIFVGGASCIGFFRPIVGVLAFAFLGFFNPHAYTWGFAQTLPASQVVGISTILGIVFSGKKKKLPLQRETVLLVLLWLTFLSSTMFALYPNDALQHFIRISKILLMVVLTILLVNTEDKLLWLIRVIGYSLGFYGFKAGAFAIATGGSQMVWGPDQSFLAANNSIGLALVMNIPILLFLLKNEKNWWIRWAIRAMVLFSYPAIICTFSRGAWIGLAMVTCLAVLKSRRKFVTVAFVGILVIVFQIVSPLIRSDRLAQRYGDLKNYEEESSAQSRFWNWEFCKRVGFARPFNGGGFNYYRIELYSVYYPEFAARWPGTVWSCHSTWLTVFGEHGFPGFIVWLGLLAECFKSLRRMRSYAASGPEKSLLIDYANMIQSSIIAFLVVGTFLDAAYFDMFFYLVAVIVIVKGIFMYPVKEVVGVRRSMAIRMPVPVEDHVS